MREMKPQEWIATALVGFFVSDGQSLTEGQKGDLAGRMVLACAGIQGDVDVDLFQRTVFAAIATEAR